MRTNIRYGCILILLGTTLISKAQSNDQLIANVLGQDTNVPTSFVDGMITIEHTSICDPWDDDGPCTDLCDPWDDRPCSLQKVYSEASTKERERLLVKIMTNFEKAIFNGEGGKYLTPKLMAQVKRKYPGKELKALRSRFKAYVKQLKSSK